MPLNPNDAPAHISTSFRHPENLEGIESRITVPELFDLQAKANPNYPLFTFSDGDKREFITYASVNRAIDRAARYTLAGFDHYDSTVEASAKPPTVAILARAGE